jgi:protein TonB
MWQKADFRQGRIGSAAGVAAIHAVLGYALIVGLGMQVSGRTEESLKLFNLAIEPPPAPVEPLKPVEQASQKQAGAASPPDLLAQASPVVAPEPKIRLLPPPVVAAPVPSMASDPSAGAAPIPGPGTGSGGTGDGTGSGGDGNGAGSGVASGAELIKGRIKNSDYPKAASRAQAGGTVIAKFTVGVDGRPSGCSVLRSSGNSALDATTCRLIEQRFRYRPATDAQGRPVPETKGWKQVWWLEPREA